jgi:SpoVK/Ycf46/Vps4 family AAA+-type ATPase
MAIGIPGTGKSLTAKAAGTIFELPTLRLNISALYGKFVGDSENNLRKALATIEAVAPCVVFIDEIEKALAGAGGAGESDGGTTKRVFGEILTWLNDKESNIFVLATANDISSLPPEFKRAGRFDGIYFLDTPTRTEREAIAGIMITKYPRTQGADAAEIAAAAGGYTGAEIEAAFTAALRNAYDDGQREPTTADITAALRNITPVATAEAARLADMKSWAKTNARPASIPDAQEAGDNNREFNIE